MRDIRNAQEACAELAKGLDLIARGDFTHHIDRQFSGDLDALRTAFNATVARMRETISTMASSSNVITTGVDEIAAASGDLSRRTEQQAASLEEAAASIEQTASMVRKTAQSAVHAHEIVVKTRTDVEHGGAVVERSVEAMGRIEQASEKIHGFIGIIDEIAFQTNLLALNAGVEAARAGEAGRGFAVVASEVRALAQRSANAAQEVKELVGVSARSINDGVTLVGEVGAALSRITSQIAGIDRLVSEIATGSREQSGGLDQLNVAVRQIDDSTQQNAAMAEQTTAAVESVANEAQRLRHLMDEFHVGHAQQKPARTTHAYRAA
jgi:methyl-accepting chemotaxis protein